MSTVQATTEYRAGGEKEEWWKVNYGPLLASLPCLTLASAHTSTVALCCSTTPHVVSAQYRNLEGLKKNCPVNHTVWKCFIKHCFKNLLQFVQLLTRWFSLPLQNLCSSSSSASITTPAQVILLRFLAFLSCAFLVLMALYGSGDPFSLSAAVPAPVSSDPASIRNRTGTSSHADLENDTSVTVAGWRELLRLLPEQMVENLSAAWAYGKNHQIAVAVLGLFTCLLAMFLAGRIRWVCSFLFHLKENCIILEVLCTVLTQRARE